MQEVEGEEIGVRYTPGVVCSRAEYFTWKAKSVRVSLIGLVTLCVVLAFSATTANAFIRGDANGDTAIDIADAVAILGVLFVPGVAPLECADIGDSNDDGLFDISDGIYLLSFLFVAGSPGPPEPFPADGDDPTPDTLTPDCAPVGGGGPRGIVGYANGQNSMAPEGEYLIFDQSELDAFWDLHIVGTPPVVDFSTDMVCALVRDYPSPDHCCQITDLTDSGVETEISYIHWENMLPCSFAFLSPTPAFHIVIWEGAPGVSTDSVAFETITGACPVPCP